MSDLMNEFANEQKRRTRFALLVVGACVAGVGTWLLGPLGVVMIGMGNIAGWAVVVAAAVLLAAMIVAIVFAVRTRVVRTSQPGKANPRFDEPEPSRNPNGGNAMIGSGIGGH